MKILIKDLIGHRCVLKAEGQALYDAIYPSLEIGQSVILDFKDVEIVSTNFLMSSIGQMLKTIKSGKLFCLLNFINLRESDARTIDIVVDFFTIHYEPPKEKMKTKTKKQKKVKKVFKEFGEGKLHSGSKKGPVVTSRKQATAIALSEAGMAKNKKKAPDRLYVPSA